MKTLEHNVLIYDAECPLCNLYSGAFVKYGLLDANGRHDYAQLQEFSACELIDKYKSRNEIALVNTHTQEVRYGLDSLLYILGTNFPLFKPIFANKLFLAIMQQVYNLISYNRKVIAPSKKFNPMACVPDFSFLYRFIFILLSLYFSLGMTYYYTNSNIYALGGVALFWVANVAFSLIMWKNWAIIYLGHLATLLVIGVLVVLPAALLQAWLGIWAWSIFGGIATVVFIGQYVRRYEIVTQEISRIINTSSVIES